MSLLAASQVVEWLVIIGLSVVVLALARQVGLLHERTAPAGLRVTEQPPMVGQTLAARPMRTLDNAPYTLGGAGGPRLLLFVAADCPVCKRVVGPARTLALASQVGLILIADGALPSLRAMQTALGVTDIPFVHGPDLGAALRISQLPYGLLIDGNSVIRAAGLAGSSADLQVLLAASDTPESAVLHDAA